MANLDKIRFYPRPTWESRMANGIFEGSNVSSGGPYTLIYQIPGQPSAGWNEVVNVDLSPYRWLRYKSPDDGYGNVTEIEFYRNGVKATGVGFGSLGSFENNGMTFHKALDGDLGTYFDGATWDNQFVGVDAPISAPPISPSSDNMSGQGSHDLLYQIARNTAGVSPRPGDGIYDLVYKICQNTAGVLPFPGDGIHTLYYKIAGNTAGVFPKPGDGIYNLLYKIAGNTGGSSPVVGDGVCNLLYRIAKNTSS